MLRRLLVCFGLWAATVLAQAQTSAPTPTPIGPDEIPAEAASSKVTYSSVNTAEPYIALTFDDGPSAKNTPRLLKMLAERNIKATFFLVGQCVQDNPSLVKQELAEGHEVANHSWSHPNLALKSEEAVRAELSKTHEAIKQACGQAPTLFRPPYGSFTERQRRWANQEFGYRTILWDVDPLDWKRPGPAVVAERILTSTRPGSIVLAHDIHEQTIDAVPRVLDGLLAKGFKFVTVSELLAMDKPKPPAATTSSASAKKAKAASAKKEALPDSL